MRKAWHRVLVCAWLSFASLFGLSAFAQESAPHDQDPLESFNRVVFNFNRGLDRALIKPVAYLYWRYFPQPLQISVGNFYDNLREIPNVANDLLQFQFAFAANDTSRLLINSTIGVLGFFDVATKLGLERHKNDFGQTLYHWGYRKSSYLVLPLIGPSTFRDGIGFGVDYFALSIWPWIGSDWYYPLLTVDVVDTRARLLRSEPVVGVVAIDEYSFIRDAYFQRRQYLFNQGVEPETEEVDPYLDEVLE